MSFPPPDGKVFCGGWRGFDGLKLCESVENIGSTDPGGVCNLVLVVRLPPLYPMCHSSANVSTIKKYIRQTSDSPAKQELVCHFLCDTLQNCEPGTRMSTSHHTRHRTQDNPRPALHRAINQPTAHNSARQSCCCFFLSIPRALPLLFVLHPAACIVSVNTHPGRPIREQTGGLSVTTLKTPQQWHDH